MRGRTPAPHLPAPVDSAGDVQPEELASAFSVLLRALVAKPAVVTPSPPSEPWLTIAEGARHAAVSDETLREWITLGSLPAGRCGRVLRVRRSDIDTLLLKGSIADGGEGGNLEVSERSAQILSTLKPSR